MSVISLGLDEKKLAELQAKLAEYEALQKEVVALKGEATNANQCFFSALTKSAEMKKYLHKIYEQMERKSIFDASMVGHVTLPIGPDGADTKTKLTIKVRYNDLLSKFRKGKKAEAEAEAEVEVEEVAE